MTRQESFKRRVRDRMARTGERYGAARRTLIEQSERPASGRSRTWVAEPETNDDAVRTATGRGWDEWCDVIDAWPGKDQGHAAIATHVREEHDVDGWWAQTVTVGYERITGLRLPFQRPDGTFEANKARTIVTDVTALRAMLLDEDDRAHLFPGMDTELRSRPTSKNVRIAIGPGVALFTIDPRSDGKVKVTVTHQRLAAPEDVDAWKSYWANWLEALDES